MDKIEKIRQEIERLKGTCTTQIKANPGQTFPFVMEMTGYDKLLSFLDTLSEEPSESLEEAAEKYAGVNYDCETETDAFYHHIETESFKAGAEWQKEQLMKDAVEGYVNYYEDSGGILMAEAQVGCPYHIGDKVRIIIVKER